MDPDYVLNTPWHRLTLYMKQVLINLIPTFNMFRFQFFHGTKLTQIRKTRCAKINQKFFTGIRP